MSEERLPPLREARDAAIAEVEAAEEVLSGKVKARLAIEAEIAGLLGRFKVGDLIEHDHSSWSGLRRNAKRTIRRYLITKTQLEYGESVRYYGVPIRADGSQGNGTTELWFVDEKKTSLVDRVKE